MENITDIKLVNVIADCVVSVHKMDSDCDWRQLIHRIREIESKSVELQNVISTFCAWKTTGDFEITFLRSMSFDNAYMLIFIIACVLKEITGEIDDTIAIVEVLRTLMGNMHTEEDQIRDSSALHLLLSLNAKKSKHDAAMFNSISIDLILNLLAKTDSDDVVDLAFQNLLFVQFSEIDENQFAKLLLAENQNVGIKAVEFMEAKLLGEREKFSISDTTKQEWKKSFESLIPILQKISIPKSIFTTAVEKLFDAYECLNTA